MYSASQDFHEAVANGNHQMPLLIFQDAVFTQADIDVDAGIEFDDNFNLEENLAIGQATSNEIRFTLFNDARLLNDYGFGEFVATIGVHTATEAYVQYAPLVMNTNYAQYYGYESSPFIRRNGEALSPQPSFAVKSMLGYDGKVWAFSGDGRYAVYDDKTGQNITAQNPVNAFMRDKSKAWDGRAFFYNPSSRRLAIYDAGDKYWYEFVPLGTFIAERPKVPDRIRIEMTCHDRMTKFDKDMPSAGELGVKYPVTVKALLQKLCDYVGVPYNLAKTFINSVASISKEPEAFKNATMRQVVMWLAEAAGSNARFNRDGKFVLDWLRSTAQKYAEGDYMDFQPTWYETQRINKMVSRDSQGSADQTVGSGNVGYLILDNPILRG